MAVPGSPAGQARAVTAESGAPVTVRRATMEDHAAILAIDATIGAYDAGDYLYGKLAMYLTDPNRICYVAEADGKIIGFTSTRLTDAGRNIIGRLARVERGLRETGVWVILREHSFFDTHRLYPDAVNFYGCTSSWKDVPTFRKGWQIKMNRTYVHIYVDQDKRLISATGRPEVKMERISIARCHQILSDEKYHFQVFPHGMVVVGREPMRILPCNFHLLTAECKQILASHDVTSGELLTMSFGTGFFSPQGYVYEVDLYTAVDDPLELTRHILGHIDVAKRHITSEKKLIISAFVCQKYGIKPVIECLQASENGKAFHFSDVRHHHMGGIAIKGHFSYLPNLQASL